MQLQEDVVKLSPSYMIELTADEQATIQAVIERLPSLDLLSVTDDLITEIELAHRDMPERLAQALINFRRLSNDYGTLLIRNLPLDPYLPLTPQDGRKAPDKLSWTSEYSLLLLMTYLGEPIAYADEKEGLLIQNICPIMGQEQRQENTGSTFLEFHTEDGFHPHKPDFLSLICLRSDHDLQAKTASASIRRAIRTLPAKILAILREPHYHIRLASSFCKSAESHVYCAPMPVLSGDFLEPDLCVDFYAMEALNPIAALALDYLKEELQKVVIEWTLMPGDMMIVDNRVAAHARTAFQPRYDGKDRWLQRLFVVQDYRRSRASRSLGGRVCTSLSVEFSASLLPVSR